jgi:adenosylcobinamide-phosphate synthase
MALLTLAIILDAIIGDPDSLWKRVPHPVVLFGRVISFFEEKRDDWNLETLGTNQGQAPGFVAGLVLLAAFAVLCIFVSVFVDWISAIYVWLSWVVELIIVTALIAQKSLYEHVARVRDGLKSGGVEGGRDAVSMIVGRDVSQLSVSGVCKAAIESLAENFSDGVVAPIFWYAVLGLPGILFYKAVNTADSMIGHRTEEYEQFGKSSAILDDWMNWPAARLAAGLAWWATLVHQGWKRSESVWKTTRADAPHHRSPNAGWPEAAFAAALEISLGGDRSYGTEMVSARKLNESGRDELEIADIDRALHFYCTCCFSLFCLSALGWLLFS